MNIILTLLILTIIVFVHELGHFLTAKFFKMTVNEFSIGFGKVLFKKHYKGTDYKIRLLPIGGFVDLEGEKDTTSKNSFRNRPYHQKFVVLIAGVVMNVILAIVLLAIFLSANGYKFAIANITPYEFNNTESVYNYSPATIVSISEDSKVVDYLEKGENIVEIDNQKFEDVNEFIDILKTREGLETEFKFIDIETFDTYTKTFDVPLKNSNGSILNAELSGGLGSVYFIKYNSNVTSGVSMSYDVFVYQIKALGSIVGNAFSSGDYTEVSKNVGGVVLVADTVNTVLSINDLSFLVAFTAFISLSLAFFNILPIPALDGGHILIMTLEKIFRRKFPDRVVNYITLVGFVILMGFGILVTFKDLIQIGLIDNIKSLLNL